jgi:hypothetical protein
MPIKRIAQRHVKLNPDYFLCIFTPGTVCPEKVPPGHGVDSPLLRRWNQVLKYEPQPMKQIMMRFMTFVWLDAHKDSTDIASADGG